MIKLLFTLSIMILFTFNLKGQNADSLGYSNFINYKVGFNIFSGGEIIKELILNSPELKFVDSLANSMYKITSFTMTIVVRGKIPLEFINIENGLLTKEMKMEIKSSPVGTKLYFEHMKCIDKNGRVYSVYASSFIIN